MFVRQAIIHGSQATMWLIPCLHSPKVSKGSLQRILRFSKIMQKSSNRHWHLDVCGLAYSSHCTISVPPAKGKCNDAGLIELEGQHGTCHPHHPNFGKGWPDNNGKAKHSKKHKPLTNPSAGHWKPIDSASFGPFWIAAKYDEVGRSTVSPCILWLKPCACHVAGVVSTEITPPILQEVCRISVVWFFSSAAPALNRLERIVRSRNDLQF